MAFSNTEVVFNNLFGLFTYLAVLVGIIVFALMAFLIIKYRERKDSQDPEDTPRLGRIPMVRGHGRNMLITVSLSTHSSSSCIYNSSLFLSNLLKAIILRMIIIQLFRSLAPQFPQKAHYILSNFAHLALITCCSLDISDECF